MNIHFIKSSEKKRILEQLEEQFGIEKLPYLLIQSGKDKIRAFSGHLSKDEILKMSQLANIEVIGLYLLRREHDLRLSFDAVHLLKNQINKNILKISHDEMQAWLRGHNLKIENKDTRTKTLIIKHQDYFLGSGRLKSGFLINHVPKERRLKKP